MASLVSPSRPHLSRLRGCFTSPLASQFCASTHSSLSSQYHIYLAMTKVPLLMCNTTTNNNERTSRREENQIKGSLMVKPKIRIVHVFAPKVIETDPANFRQLVQRLTGKPAARKGIKSRSKRRKNDHKIMVMKRVANEKLVPLEVQLMEEASSSTTSSPSCSWDRYRCDPMIGMKEEEGMWRAGLEDFDGFVQGLESPFMPLLNNISSDHHIDMLI